MKILKKIKKTIILVGQIILTILVFPFLILLDLVDIWFEFDTFGKYSDKVIDFIFGEVG